MNIILMLTIVTLTAFAHALRIKISKKKGQTPKIYFCSYNPFRRAPTAVTLTRQDNNEKIDLQVVSKMFPTRMTTRLEFCFKLRYREEQIPLEGGSYIIALKDSSGKAMNLKGKEQILVTKDKKDPEKVVEIVKSRKKTRSDDISFKRTKELFDLAIKTNQKIKIDGHGYNSLSEVDVESAACHVYFAQKDDTKQAVVIKVPKVGGGTGSSYDNEKKALKTLGMLVQGLDSHRILVQKRIFGINMYKAIQETKNFDDLKKFKKIFQEAYAKARSKGLQHLDLHMNNVIIDHQGEGHLIDWGLSSFVSPQSKESVDAPLSFLFGTWWSVGPVKSPEPNTPIKVGEETFYALGLSRKYQNGIGSSLVVRDLFGNKVEIIAKFQNKDVTSRERVKLNNGEVKMIKFHEYTRLKEVVKALGMLVAYDDDVQTVAIRLSEGESLQAFVRRTGDLNTAKKYWLEAYENAHKNGVLIDNYDGKNVIIAADGTVSFSDRPFAIKVDSYIASDDAEKLFQREMKKAESVWNRAVNEKDLKEFLLMCFMACSILEQ